MCHVFQAGFEFTLLTKDELEFTILLPPPRKCSGVGVGCQCSVGRQCIEEALKSWVLSPALYKNKLGMVVQPVIPALVGYGVDRRCKGYLPKDG